MPKSKKLLHPETMDTEMGENDADEKTVRGYLVALLAQVWAEDEGFSGKRPFGNSGWQSELTEPLIDAGIAASEGEAHEQIALAIQAMR